jgi:hypothetical protein
LPAIARWAAETGLLQIPAWDRRLFDVATAAESQTYCDDLTGMLAEHGLVSELTSHIFGQLMAVHPAYDAYATALRRRKCTATHKPAANGHGSSCSWRSRPPPGLPQRSGYLLWLAGVALSVPVPQRPEGLIETAFDELARRWMPVLNACDEQGINLCYEIHP